MLFLLTLLLVQYQGIFSFQHSLALCLIEDPGPRLSLYPWLMESARQLRSGHFPLWCALEGAGFPLLANYQSSPLNPFNLLFALFPYLKVLDLILILKLVLLGIFTYLFARALGLSPLAGATSGVIICFCGYVSKNLNWVLINSELWLPAGLLLVEKIYQSRRKFFAWLGLILVSFMVAVGGNPQVSLYVYLFIFFYLIFRGSWARRRESFGIIFALVLGLILASFQTLSFWEYLSYGWHIHSPELNTIARPRLKFLYSLFFPWVYGAHRSYLEQLFMREYLGLVPVFLALLSLSSGLKNRKLVFFWAWLLVFLGVIYWIPPFHLINLLPGFNRIANIKYAYFGVCFSLAILAGFGIERYLTSLSSRKYGMALGLACGLAFLSLLLVYRYPPSVSYPPFRNAWLEPMLLFIFASGVGIYGVLFQERKICGLGLVFLAGVNLIYFYPGFNPQTKIDPARWRFFQPKPPSYLLPIIQEKEPVRFIGLEGVFHHNFNLIYQINDLRVFEALYPKDYVQMMGEIEGFELKQAMREFFKHGWSFDVRKENLNSLWLDRLGVKYLLSKKEINAPGWKLQEKSKDYYLYKNSEAWRRAWILKQDSSPDFSSAKITIYQPDRVIVEINPPQDGYLILADQYAPGWRAFIYPSGREKRIFKHELLFRRIELEPATERVEMVYRPFGFLIGLYVSLGSFLFFLFIFWQGLKKLREIPEAGEKWEPVR